tara:strand:- start:175809 stop:176288 length:480 start_codon:yes stop_codon:yes gene_type:complete
LNPDNKAYLRSLEQDFGGSTNGIRLELNKLEQANMLTHAFEGKKKVFQVNTQHPLYQDINSIVRKYFGLDLLLDKVLNRLENLEAVYLLGDLANGLQSGVMELLIVGDPNRQYLMTLLEKLEKNIDKKIAFSIFYKEDNYYTVLQKEKHLLLWNSAHDE